MWVVAMAHQLAVPVVRVMALMQSAAALPSRPVGLLAAGIVAPMAPALPTVGLCQR
jgi:hypothetical protein